MGKSMRDKKWEKKYRMIVNLKKKPRINPYIKGGLYDSNQALLKEGMGIHIQYNILFLCYIVFADDNINILY